jgi:hypothetical protein
MTIQSKKAVPVTDTAPSAENSENTLVAKGQDTKPRKRLLAELGLSPILPNANTARCFAKTAIDSIPRTIAILGGYAAVAPMETFTASPTDPHPTDLAMLRGARLVAAQETEEGRRWAEGRIACRGLV